MTPDPIGLDGGINLYAYVANDPINEIDPFGLTKGGPQHGSGPGTASDSTIRKAIDALKANKDGNGREAARKILKEEIDNLTKELRNTCGKSRTAILNRLRMLRAFLKTGLRNLKSTPVIIVIIDPNTGLPIGMQMPGEVPANIPET